METSTRSKQLGKQFNFITMGNTLYGLRVPKALIEGLKNSLTYEELKTLRNDIRHLMQQRLDDALNKKQNK